MVISLGRRRKTRRCIAAIVVVGLVVVFLGGAVHLVDRMLRPALFVIARNRVQGKTFSMLTDVIETEAAEPFHYSDLIEVETTPDGYVSYMMPNTMRIARLMSRIGGEAQEQINRLEKEDLSIPLGQLSGIAILSHLGPNIPVRVLPVGTASVSVDEEFAGVGVNHVKHTIFLEVDCDVRIAVPLIEETLEVSVRMPVAEAVIVGPVPEMYMNLELPSLHRGG